MLHDQGLLLFFWAEACNTVVYLHNRSSYRVLGNVTPNEAYWRNKPQVGHFRIFGCLTYSHVPKLEPTTEKGIFICYSASKVYRIYIHALRRVVVR